MTAATVMNPPIMLQGRGDHNADDMRAAVMGGMLPDGMTVRQGIVPGWGDELSVEPNSPAAMEVVVGAGVIDLPAPQDGHGGWRLVNASSLVLTIGPSDPINPRTDLVVARVADSQYVAGADDAADILVIEGTAGAGAPVPTIPSTEGTYQVLAQVAVAASASSIVSADITLNTPTERPYTAAAGGILQVQNATQRNALPPGSVRWVLQLDTGTLYRWDGASWTGLSIDTVGGLQAALDGKSNTNHTHDPSGYSVAYATNSGHATTADSANYATSSGHASSADTAGSAGYANSAGSAPANGGTAATVSSAGCYHASNGITCASLASTTQTWVRCDASGNLYNSGAPSSARYKKDVQPVENDPHAVLQVEPITFTYDSSVEGIHEAEEAEGRHIGVIAEQVEELGLTELLRLNPEDGSTYGVQYEGFALLLIPVVRELRDQVAELATRVQELENPS